MRTAGSLRVILNTKIFPEMNVEKPTEKNIRLTGMDDLVPCAAQYVCFNFSSNHLFLFQNEQSVKVFLVGGSPKDIGGMYAALRRRVDKLKAESATTSLGNEGASDVSGSIKRKHDGNGDIPVETTRPEKEAKTT
jgi:Ran-binding protein 3